MTPSTVFSVVVLWWVNCVWESMHRIIGNQGVKDSSTPLMEHF